MGKLFLIIFTLVTCLNVSAQIPNAETLTGLPKEKCAFLQLPKPQKLSPPDSISSSQLLEDVDILEYLFQTAYSGYYFWKKKGVDFDKISVQLRELALKQEHISTKEIELLIRKGTEGMIDGHLGIHGNFDYSPYKHKDVYFADIVIEKQGDKYCVIKSDEDAVKPGDMFTDSDTLLFRTLSPGGKQHFLIGVFSYSKVRKILININHQDKQILFHRCKINNVGNNDNNRRFTVDYTSDVPVIRLANLFSGADDSDLSAFSEEGLKLRKSESFILDITGNSGGNSKYIEDFFSNLNHKTVAPMLSGVMNSPAIAQSWTWMNPDDFPAFKKYILQGISETKEFEQNPERRWKYSNQLNAKVKQKYSGRSFLLMNSGCASSAEMGISYFAQLKNNLLIGENSAGVNTFGNTRAYQLKHSKINIVLPSCLYYYQNVEDGTGFLPDLWLDSKTPVSEVQKWIKYFDNYCFEPQKEKFPQNTDFETWNNNFPVEWAKITTQFNGQTENLFLCDSVDKASGKYSLCLFADSLTDGFECLSLALPVNADSIKVQFSAKLIRTESQSAGRKAMAGFLLIDKNFQQSFVIEQFRSNFDWKEFSLTANLRNENLSKVLFFVMSTCPGKLWIDNVRFEEK